MFLSMDKKSEHETCCVPCGTLSGRDESFLEVIVSARDLIANKA